MTRGSLTSGEEETRLVSVVTPFHNTAKYLAECIESVLAQTHENFEYLLVDNQSTDGGGEIARRYSEKDGRIRVVDTPVLLDQVRNYNFALGHISNKSKWTKICQADDWLYPRCIEELVRVGESDDSIGLVSSFYLRGTEILGGGLPVDLTVLTGREVCRLHLLDRVTLFGSPTTVLYRSDLVRSRPTFYETGRLHEDTEVCFELLQHTNFGFSHQILSFARVERTSIMGQREDLRVRDLDRVIVLHRYGPLYLAPDEFRETLSATMSEYYRGLARRAARGLVTRDNRRLFAYHRAGLSSVDVHLSMPRLFAGIVSGAFLDTTPIGALRRIRRQSTRSSRLRALDDR